jgi:hypothetical protein
MAGLRAQVGVNQSRALHPTGLVLNSPCRPERALEVIEVRPAIAEGAADSADATRHACGQVPLVRVAADQVQRVAPPHLSVPMHPSDALLDAVGIPRQLDRHHHSARVLKVQPLRRHVASSTRARLCSKASSEAARSSGPCAP